MVLAFRLCGLVRGAKTQKSSLSRTDPGLDSLSLSDHSNGSIAALQAPAAAWTSGLNQAFLSYCLELLPRWRHSSVG